MLSSSTKRATYLWFVTLFLAIVAFAAPPEASAAWPRSKRAQARALLAQAQLLDDGFAHLFERFACGLDSTHGGVV